METPHWPTVASVFNHLAPLPLSVRLATVRALAAILGAWYDPAGPVMSEAAHRDQVVCFRDLLKRWEQQDV